MPLPSFASLLGLLSLAAFQPPVRLTGGGGSSAPDLALLGAACFVVHVDGDASGIALRVAGQEGAELLAPGAGPGASPQVAVGLLGQVAVAYLAPGGADGLCLWLARREGEGFGPPEKVAAGLAAPAAHDLAFTARGAAELAWSAPASAEGPPAVFLRKDGKTFALGEGEGPRLRPGPAGFTHAAYLVQGSVGCRSDRDDPDFLVERRVQVPGGALACDLAVGPEDEAHVAVEGPLGIYLAALGSGSASPSAEPVPGAEGGRAPRLAVLPGGTLGLAFLRGGRILFVRRSSSYDAPEEVIAPAEVEELALAAGDAALAPEGSTGIFHLAFQAGGDVYYASDAPPPVPAFTASATRVFQGEEVAFRDESSGVILSREWDFGDGVRDRGGSPRHRYRAPGTYAVSLAVSGPAGLRRYVLPERIRVAPAADLLEVPTVRAHGGSRLVVPVLLTSSAPVRGFQLVLGFPSGIALEGASFEGTRTEILAPELLSVEREQGAGGEVLVAAALWDYAAPFDGRVLPPGADQALLLLGLRVPAGAAAGSSVPIPFLRDHGPQAKSSLVVSEEGLSAFPFPLDGRIEIAEAAEASFLRGDSNGDLEVDISDAVATLGYLFLGDDVPSCLDAADGNDDGRLDVSDPIDLLQFLFGGGISYPAYPYPVPGLDGTPDELAPCGGGAGRAP